MISIVAAVRQLALNAPAVRVENFFSGVLGLNAVQRGQYFPNPDPTGLLEIAVGHLTRERERILQTECSITISTTYKFSNMCGINQGRVTSTVSKCF